MKKYQAMYLVIVFALAICLLGCATTKSKTCASLTEGQKVEVSDWMHSANLAYDIGDFELAREYYNRIAVLYPDTKYAKRANKKLCWLNKKF